MSQSSQSNQSLYSFVKPTVKRITLKKKQVYYLYFVHQHIRKNEPNEIEDEFYLKSLSRLNINSDEDIKCDKCKCDLVSVYTTKRCFHNFCRSCAFDHFIENRGNRICVCGYDLTNEFVCSYKQKYNDIKKSYSKEERISIADNINDKIDKLINKK